MKMLPQYHCDLPGCEAIKGPVNHWWLVDVKGNGVISIYPWELPQSVGYHDQEGVKHFCGQAHALQFVSSIMGENRG
jgi:hypothetical protein